jgi:RNA polymerase sigma-70 factor (ECF subfamily)
VGVKNWWAYLLTILRHEAARSKKRSHQGKNEQPIEITDPATFHEEENCLDKLPQLDLQLNRLPDEQKQVVRLKTEAGLTFAEIAELLQLSPNTAASRYRYAIDRLRRELREDSNETN